MTPEDPVVLEVSAYTDLGSSLVPAMLMAPCDQMAVMIGPIQCRMGVGDEGVLAACPMPVEAVAISEFADLAIVGGTAAAMQPAAPANSNAASGEIIPIDLGGRDPQQVLQSLFTQR